jgi:hypothetical protein
MKWFKFTWPSKNRMLEVIQIMPLKICLIWAAKVSFSFTELSVSVFMQNFCTDLFYTLLHCNLRPVFWTTFSWYRYRELSWRHRGRSWQPFPLLMRPLQLSPPFRSHNLAATGCLRHSMPTSCGGFLACRLIRDRHRRQLRLMVPWLSLHEAHYRCLRYECCTSNEPQKRGALEPYLSDFDVNN